MAFEITVPSNDETYSLIADLSLMATQISGYLTALSDDLNGKVESGDSGSFESIAVEGSGQFNQVIVNGTVPNSVINNTEDGFGLSANGLTFLSKGTKWQSSGQIQVPSGGIDDDAVNYTSLNAILAPYIDRITALEAAVSGLGNTYVAKTTYNSGQAAQDAQIAQRATIASVGSKVNAYQGNVRMAELAALANVSNHLNGQASDSARIAGRLLNVGRSNVGSIPASTSRTLKISYPARSYTPIIFAQATADDGDVSIVCSVDDITASTAVIRYKNLNQKKSESTYLNWMVL